MILNEYLNLEKESAKRLANLNHDPKKADTEISVLISQPEAVRLLKFLHWPYIATKKQKTLRILFSKCLFYLVAGAGFEPTTFGL